MGCLAVPHTAAYMGEVVQPEGPSTYQCILVGSMGDGVWQVHEPSNTHGLACDTWNGLIPSSFEVGGYPAGADCPAVTCGDRKRRGKGMCSRTMVLAV